ncbi:unnamed protein product [Cylicostephanus goldi]|uniref:Uncharacterized protein n=1 Tax=Cylicostephanus goldi TaxID=71465 RepID=A0A3P6USS4_CYLGO|nr:unnamed protein product [Cylicostephanus goldi]
MTDNETFQVKVVTDLKNEYPEVFRSEARKIYESKARLVLKRNAACSRLQKGKTSTRPTPQHQNGRQWIGW